MRRQSRTILVAVGLGTLALAGGHPAQAQLISPGKLSSAHRELEGITKCTSCHKLGEAGSSEVACLSCHKPLSTRIREGRGFHASVADQSCEGCHEEHLGRDFDMIRLDTMRFDHAATGYDLAVGHRAVACRGCHRPEHVAAVDVRERKMKSGSLGRTYLGVATQCGTCHIKDSPHRNQFSAQDCDSCHKPSDWKTAELFDHDRAAFRLLGRHRDAACIKCHPAASASSKRTVRLFRGLEFESCASCHGDPHRGKMGPRKACSSCHGVSGWHRVRVEGLRTGFDHDRTGFPLVASHKRAVCDACHSKPAPDTPMIRIRFREGTRSAAVPRPHAESCASCHRDYHAGQLSDSSADPGCTGCHTEVGWLPTTFDLESHSGTRFALTGAHMAVPCAECHRSDSGPGSRPTFQLEDVACSTCHAQQNVHGDRFVDPDGVTACESCHQTASWKVGDRFEHSLTGFALTGSHAAATCESCHGEIGIPRAAAGAPTLDAACSSCHDKQDPHESQFEGYTCERCHDTVSFRIAAFDHSTTRFSLTGAHESVPCGACHPSEASAGDRRFARFKPLSVECESCHGGDKS